LMLSGCPILILGSQAMCASGSQTQTQPKFGLLQLQRRLVTSELRHIEEDVAHSLLLEVIPCSQLLIYIPIHNLLHSPAMLALRCRDRLLDA
jgi:hypothetical protein